MELISKERLGELIDTPLVVAARQAFVNYDHGKDDPLKAYRENFEKKYIESVDAYYRDRAPQVLKDNGILSYMAYAFDKLSEEDERAKRYLDFTQNDSYQRCIAATVNVLVVQFQDQLLNEAAGLISRNSNASRCSFVVSNHTKLPDLRMLYTLLNKTTDGISPLIDQLGNYITTEGLDTMRKNAENIVNVNLKHRTTPSLFYLYRFQDCEKYVEELLKMFIKFSRIVDEAFCNDARFLTIRDKAFQEVVNNTQVFSLELSNQKVKGKPNMQPPESKCPELLANYCDLLLRKSTLTKRLTSEEIDEKLNNVVSLVINQRSE